MPKIIIKVPNIKAKKSGVGMLRYIATREGVDKNINRQVVVGKPTKKQLEYIKEMLRICPDSKDTYEYEDYMDNPTRQNASALIAVMAESNPEIFESRAKYLDYISTRPRVEKYSEHGLFGNEDDVDYAGVKAEIEEHKSIIWTPIISLRREDAARLGYDNASAWRDLIHSHQMNLAEIFGIPQKDFRWYAAFHNEGHHPHVHMMVYAKDSSRGHLSENGIREFKSMLVKDIFRNEMYEIYDEKTRQREYISEETKKQLKDLVDNIQQSGYSDSPVCEMIMDLSRKLKTVKGKKTYGYLPKSLKKDVDEIVKTMAQNENIRMLYETWCDIQKKIIGMYNDQEVEHPPLWENAEFKKIKNAVIHEAEKLDVDRVFVPQEEHNTEIIAEEERPYPVYDEVTENVVIPKRKEAEHQPQTQEQNHIEPIAMGAALNLFCRLATIIDNDAEHKIDGHNKTIVDSKEWKELMKKRQRLGIKMQ